MPSLRAFLAAAAAFFASAQTPAGYSALSTQVCVNGLGNAASAGANVVPSLPRLNRRGARISSDIGSYSLVSCSGVGGLGGCSLALPSNLASALQSGAPNTILAYVEGPLGYGAVGIVFAVLSFLFAIVFTFARCCCGCCCRRDTYLGLCCTAGGSEPMAVG